MPQASTCEENFGRYDPKLEAVLKNRRRLGRYMPSMKVIPPGLDFSSLKVALPEDPARKEMEQMKPAYNARITTSPRQSRHSVEEAPEHRPCESTIWKLNSIFSLLIFNFFLHKSYFVTLASTWPHFLPSKHVVAVQSSSMWGLKFDANESFLVITKRLTSKLSAVSSHSFPAYCFLKNPYILGGVVADWILTWSNFKWRERQSTSLGKEGPAADQTGQLIQTRSAR